MVNDGPGEVVKEEFFRSFGRGVNENNDMVRVTIDLPKISWMKIKGEVISLLEKKKIEDEKISVTDYSSMAKKKYQMIAYAVGWFQGLCDPDHCDKCDFSKGDAAGCWLNDPDHWPTEQILNGIEKKLGIIS